MDAERRAGHYRDEVDRFVSGQHNGRLGHGLDAAHVVFALIALSAWWQTVPQLAEMITGAGPNDLAERARRRAFVVEAARRLATPR